MTDRPFRFGIVAGQAPDMKTWTGLARRVEELGYDTLLGTDPLMDLDPLTVMSAAAAVTTTLHVGTFVAVDMFRDRRLLGWQAESLSKLTSGRFELGLGTGQPGSIERIEALGADPGTTSDRVDHLTETLTYLRQQPERPRLLVAAVRRRMLALAARAADIVTLAWGPRTTRAEAADVVERFRQVAGSRIGDIELAINLLAVGDTPAPWLQRLIGVGVPELMASGAVTVLPGTARQAADTLLRWRDELGVSYVTINSSFAEAFAPIVECLKGT